MTRSSTPSISTLPQQLARAFSDPGIDLLAFSADGSLETGGSGARSFLGRQVDSLVLIPVPEQLNATWVSAAAAAVYTIQSDRRVAGTAAVDSPASPRTGPLRDG